MPRTYRARIVIESVDKGPSEFTEVHLGNMQAESIATLAAHASTLGPSFSAKKDPVAEHERLVAAQNQETHGETHPEQSADDHAGH